MARRYARLVARGVRGAFFNEKKTVAVLMKKSSLENDTSPSQVLNKIMEFKFPVFLLQSSS